MATSKTELESKIEQLNRYVSTLPNDITTRIEDGWDYIHRDIGDYNKHLVIDDTPTLESKNPVTSDGIKRAIDAKDGLPIQEGNSGKFLQTNGINAQWTDVDALPPQSGNDGRFLKTNGTSAEWSDIKLKSDIDYVDYFDNIYNDTSADIEKTAWEIADDAMKSDIDSLKKSYKERVLGQIVHSLIPLKDKCFHLVDGDVLYDGGIYSGFYNYVKSLQTEYPDMFIDEAGWNTCVDTYGSCGKFVLTGSYVRLPKISNIIQGTTDTDALGDLVEAGLPNITGEFDILLNGTGYALRTGLTSGSFYTEKTRDRDEYIATSNIGTNTNGHYAGRFSASRSNSIYGNSTTVQPQTIKSLIYICVITEYDENTDPVNIEQVTNELTRLDNNISVIKNTSYGFYKFPMDNAIHLSTQGQELTHSLTITTKKGNPVFVSITGDSNSVNDLAWINIWLIRDDIKLAHQICVSESSSTNNPFGLSFLDVVPIGTYTYTVKFTLGSSNGTYLNETSSMQSPNFLVYEI